MKCSAAGCSFVSNEVATAAAAPGLRLYCPFHAMGREAQSRELLLRPPCACGRAAAGFERVVGGFTARHQERKCLERTIRASPDDITVPASQPPKSSPPVEPARAGSKEKCACGKRSDGISNASGSFTEWHTKRECIEQTIRVGTEA
jgi:hypothetical protein